MPDRLPTLGDKELTRMEFRLGLFRRRGMPERMAEKLVDRLVLRDLERDDRRACIECANFQGIPGTDRPRTCFYADPGFSTQPLLQRCPRFNFQTPQ